jgi:predicted RND superfamily exporter protein
LVKTFSRWAGVFEKLYRRLYDLSSSKTVLILSATLIVSFLSLAGLFTVGYDSDVSVMLPDDEVVRRCLRFFRDSNISNKLVLSLGLKDDEKATGDLFRAVDEAAASMGPPLFAEVTTGVSDTDAAIDMEGLASALPFMVTGEYLLEKVDPLINRGEVRRKLGEAYVNIMQPGGIFLDNMFRSDPMGLGITVLERLRRLSRATGFEVGMDDGHFVSPDGRHSMLIAKANVNVMDVEGSRRLMNRLWKILEGLPEYVSVDMISGHAHSVSNEDTIRRDIKLTVAAASAVFFLLFVVVIGDLSSLAIFLIPMFSVTIGVNVSYLLFGELSYSVVGLSAVVAGISIDYGIHVYFAARKGAMGPENVKLVARPVAISALTTVGMFFAFFASNIKGYHQMAFLSIVSILFSLSCALFVLPHFLALMRGFSGSKLGFIDSMEGARLSSVPTVVVWLLMTLFMAWQAMDVGFNPSASALDGTRRGIIESEERLYDDWGMKKLAVLVAEAGEYEAALEMGDKLYKEVEARMGPDSLSGMTQLRPSKKQMAANTADWDAFWSNGRERKLRTLLRDEGKVFGFSEVAFEPFFTGLYSHPEPFPGHDGLLGLEDRFVHKTRDGYRIAMYFPDRPEGVRTVGEIAEKYPSAYVVSAGILNESISGLLMSDVKRMAGIAAVIIVCLVFVFLRGVRTAAVALVPVVTSVVWLSGGVSLLGLEFNAANLVAFILVMGLCVDYGIFMVYRSASGIKSGTMVAVTLSAITTLAGAGVLLIAKHPAVFSVGVTLLIGVGSGYLSAIFVVPRLYEILGTGRSAAPGRIGGGA